MRFVKAGFVLLPKITKFKSKYQKLGCSVGKSLILKWIKGIAIQ